MSLFFGCRLRNLDLYQEEKESMLKEGILSKVFLALSREPSIPKVIQYINSTSVLNYYLFRGTLLKDV